MRSKRIVFIILVFVSGFIHALDIEDVNGTWVYDEQHLDSPDIHEWKYSWGKGLSITETTIEFDLGEKTIMMPGMGQYNIDTIYKDEEGSICLRVFYISDKACEYPIDIKVTFIDSKRVYIYCSEWKRWSSKRYSPDEKWVWYRLSGPKR